MNTPISIQIEAARSEIIGAVEAVQRLYNLPPSILDGILTNVLADVRNEGKLELLQAINQITKEEKRDENECSK